MQKNWFSQGYSAVDEYAAELEYKRQNAGKKFTPNVQIDAGQSAVLRILHDEPITFKEHYLPALQGRRSYTCLMGTEDSCPMCDAGNKPGFRGAFLVIDHRPYSYESADGTKHSGDMQVSIFKQGIRVLQGMQTLAVKKGLSNRSYDVTRTGKGTDTTYGFIPNDASELTEAEKKAVEEFLAGRTIYDVLAEELAPKTMTEMLEILSGKPAAQTNTREIQDNNAGGINFGK